MKLSKGVITVTFSKPEGHMGFKMLIEKPCGYSYAQSVTKWEKEEMEEKLKADGFK